jgi:hypothetical protein
MESTRRQILSIGLPIFWLHGCNGGSVPETVPPKPGESRFIRKPLLEIDIKREVIADPENGRKDLRFNLRLTSKEQLMELRQMSLIFLIVGRHRPNPKRPDNLGQWRMIHTEKRTFNLTPGEILFYETPVIESGEGDPWHVNYNIAYQGFVARVENKFGEEALTAASSSVLSIMFPQIRDVQAGTNFVPQ